MTTKRKPAAKRLYGRGVLLAPATRFFLAAAPNRGGMLWAKRETLEGAIAVFKGTTVRRARVWLVGPRARVEGVYIKDSGGSSFLGYWVRKL